MAHPVGAAPGVIDAVAGAMARSGIDLVALGRAWARAMPAVTLVPALGLRALPRPARAVMGLVLAAAVLPAMAPEAPGLSQFSQPWATTLAIDLARGLPVAIAAAVPLWAATMAGGVADALRGCGESPRAAVVEGGATQLGVPMSLLASAIFLGTGGPARVAATIARPDSLGSHAIRAAADDIVGGVTLAVALGGPLLAAAVVIEIAAALVARAAAPAHVHALLAPLRALGTLAVMAVVLERIAATLARVVATAP
jgi:flagellar biosynthetic protein FliR